MKFIDYGFVFTREESEALGKVLLDVESHPYTDYDKFMHELSQLRDDREVPTRFADFCEASMLRDFAKEPFVVIGNAPIDPELPRFSAENPVHDKYQLKKTWVAEGFLGMYALLTGTEMIGHAATACCPRT